MKPSTRRSQSRPWPLAAVLIAALSALDARADQVDVAQELEHLMATQGFTMKPADLESTRGIEGRREQSALIPRLRALLEGFDHVIVQRVGGGVDRVLILGEKVPYTPPVSATPEAPETTGAGVDGDIVLETERKGTSHAISLTLEGEKGRRLQQVLLLDTGADYVVLPSSLIAQLGMAPDGLHRQSVQTANGTVDAQLGTLPALWLGEQRLPQVAIAFIEDARLGGNALLGMSVLGRFRVTIDDENNRVVLAGKEPRDTQPR